MASKGYRAHELHPTLVHAPLTLLPVAAGLDLGAALSGSRFVERAACWSWFGGTGAALLAGLAGMAASQEVRAETHARDMMFLHGIGNVGILVAGAAMSLWRAGNRPTLASAMVGLAACSAAVYTGWLGGELVYGHGVGVKGMGYIVAEGMGDSPPLFSRRGGRRILGDAMKGLAWLMRMAGQTATGKHKIHAAALGVRSVPPPLDRVIVNETSPSPMP